VTEAPGIDAVKGAAVLILPEGGIPGGALSPRPFGRAKEKNGLNAKVRTAVKGVFPP
jgi:hypothetical protein